MENIFKEADILKNNLHKAKIKDFNYNPFLEPKVNIEDLSSIKLKYNDINVAKDISNNANRIIYFRNIIQDFSNNDNLDSQIEFNQYLENIEKAIESYIFYKVNSSGLYLYPPNGYCGWHTNSKCAGERFYLSWCKEDNKSFFRYQDPDTKEIHTKWEKKGWNINQFKVSSDPNKLLWHCVYSDTIRISIGFNTLVNFDNMNNFYYSRHSIIKNSTYGDWSINGKDGFINLKDIKHLLIYSKIKTLNFDEIAWKGDNLTYDKIGINCICCNGKRFLDVDMFYPPIVIKNMPNPSNKLYRLIDGKHRLMKMKIENIKQNKFYVLEYNEVVYHIHEKFDDYIDIL